MRGTYTLILACKTPLKVVIGKLGRTELDKGIYLYTGSALGKGAVSLEKRVARHRRRCKRVIWHVDYLTVHLEIRVVNVVCVGVNKRLECQVNQQILSKLNGKPVISRAGASDCKCSAHLLSLKQQDAKTVIARLKKIYGTYATPLIL